MKKMILIGILALSLVGYAKTGKCVPLRKADWFIQEVMDKQNFKLTLWHLERSGIKYTQTDAINLANLVSRESDEYKWYVNKDKKYSGTQGFEVLLPGTRACGIRNEIFDKGVDKVILDDINKRGNEHPLVLHD